MRRILMIIALVSITAAGMAQPLKLGVKAGMSINSVDITSIDDAASKVKSKDVGFTVGLVSRFTLPLIGLSVQPELIYNHSKYNIHDVNGINHKVSYNNLELPVLFGLNLLFIRLNAGPVFNLKTFKDKDNYFDVYRPNVGYAAGVGVTLLGRLDFDLRWQGYFSGKNKNFTLRNQDQALKVSNTFITISGAYFF